MCRMIKLSNELQFRISSKINDVALNSVRNKKGFHSEQSLLSLSLLFYRRYYILQGSIESWVGHKQWPISTSRLQRIKPVIFASVWSPSIFHKETDAWRLLNRVWCICYSSSSSGCGTRGLWVIYTVKLCCGTTKSELLSMKTTRSLTNRSDMEPDWMRALLLMTVT